MNFIAYCISLLLSCVTGSVPQQEAIPLCFHPTWNGAPLALAQSKDSLSIEVFKFYISDIELLQNGKPVWKEAHSYHLVDAEQISSLTCTLDIPVQCRFDQVRFNLGIDSTTNVSGALSGDLDPTKGMYWTWQSGYINLKLEGKSPKCKTRQNEFQFHLGGYLPPNNPLQSITLNTSAGRSINIGIELNTFLSEIDLSKQNHIMSPGKDAVWLSAKAARMFRIQ